MFSKCRKAFGTPEKIFAFSAIGCPERIASSTLSDIDREPLPAKRAPARVTKTSDPFEMRINGALTPVVFTIRWPDRDNRVSCPSSPAPIPDPDTEEPEQLAVIFPLMIARSMMSDFHPVPIPDPAAEEFAVQLAVIFPLIIVRLVSVDKPDPVPIPDPSA
jgi:hypothetical protein